MPEPRSFSQTKLRERGGRAAASTVELLIEHVVDLATNVLDHVLYRELIVWSGKRLKPKETVPIMG